LDQTGQSAIGFAGYFAPFVVIWLMQPAGYADFPELPRGKGEHCVEPSEIMRKDHMKFLLHQRDNTVHRGVRTKRHSLTGCIDCHVQSNKEGDFIPVDAPGQFCQACHEFTGVKPDCFECHATTPDVVRALSAVPFQGRENRKLNVFNPGVYSFSAHSGSAIISSGNFWPYVTAFNRLSVK